MFGLFNEKMTDILEERKKAFKDWGKIDNKI